MPPAPPLDQQSIVITGAAKGLGRAIAVAFHKAGSRLALLDYDAEALEALHVELPGSRVYPVDLSSAYATRAVIAAINADFTVVDTLIHNAGFLIPQAFAEMTEERWNMTFNVGIQAAYLFTRAWWNGWLASSGGCAIFVSSNSGIRACWGEGPYTATKHALEGFSQALGIEGTERGVFVHTVTPGHPMHTPMSEQNYPAELKAKWVEPEQLAPAFLYLAQKLDASLSGKRLNAWELAQGPAKEL
jgi:3-hydroxybutyrate dehydrogenase